jgi:hypothetical protein
VPSTPSPIQPEFTPSTISSKAHVPPAGIPICWSAPAQAWRGAVRRAMRKESAPRPDRLRTSEHPHRRPAS